MDWKTNKNMKTEMERILQVVIERVKKGTKVFQFLFPSAETCCLTYIVHMWSSLFVLASNLLKGETLSSLSLCEIQGMFKAFYR